MKKVFYLIMICFVLFLVGCQTGDNPGGNEGNDGVEPGTFEIIEESILENIPYLVTEDIELVEFVEEYNAYIEWTSSNEDVLSFTGAATPNKSKAEKVELSYTINIEGELFEGSKEVIVSPETIEQVEARFTKQFNINITRNYTVKDEFFGLFKVDWVSTNTDLFSNEGVYTKPVNDTEIELKYVVKCEEFTGEEKSLKLVVIGKTPSEKTDEIMDWLSNDILADLYITGDLNLPQEHTEFNVPITWESSNPDVISSLGEVTKYVYERYVTLIATCHFEDGTISTKFECVVEALDITNMSDAEILENFLSSIGVSYYKSVKFFENGAGCNQTYGHLSFYVNEETNIIQNLAPTSNKNRTGIACEVKFVVVHDTGNMSSGATALANSNYCKNGSGNTSTGWHFTTGNDGVYQQVPEGEVAYHAHGGAYDYAEYIKTNVKATWKKPHVSISDDGYIMFNTVKSDYKVPNASASLASDGPVIKIGDDGYYYISRLYYSSLGVNSTRGGNANSIGIESCVNNGSDYLLTARKTAKLVAELCMRHNVPLTCVLQHNTTSGKDCPNAMRSSNFWFTFKDMVSMEIFAKTYLTEYQFVWTGTGDISNTGVIKLGTTASQVNYSVTVKKGNNDFLTKSFTTAIN